MPDNLSGAVERLRTSAQRLNTICDTAAQVIREVESFLEESHVGVSAWVELSRVDVTGEGDHDIMGLSYRRYKANKFRIVVVKIPAGASSDADVSERPWSECTRDEKLDSLEKLSELLVTLAKNVDERTVRAEQAVTAVSSLLKLPTKKKGGA